MGKRSEKKKKNLRDGSGDDTGSPRKTGEYSPIEYDSDTLAFISMAQKLKDEGNKLFQKRDQRGAMFKYEKAIKLLPKNHIDVSNIRSNIAACYMQMGISEYPKAIRECNTALEVTPKHSKALLKRARCYEGLNRLDLAFKDVSSIVNMEPHNVMALEILERVKVALESRGLKVNDSVIELPSDYVEPPYALPPAKVVKDKRRKKKSSKAKESKIDSVTKGEKADDQHEETAAQDRNEERALNKIEDYETSVKPDEKKDDEVKEVVEEKISAKREGIPMRTVKLFYGEDIRCAQLPVNCSLLQLRQLVRDRFPSSNAVLVKYRDHEGDLVSITSDEDLRLADVSSPSQNSLRLYVVGVHPDLDPYFVKLNNEKEVHSPGVYDVPKKGCLGKEMEVKVSCFEDWIFHFAQLFKNHVGFESDRYLDIHEVGFELYNEALEETVTSEEAQNLFQTAEEKFQEMAALALFNCGNVHMSMARKRVCFTDDSSEQNKIAEIRSAYDWAQKEYMKAGEKYKEAVNIKADFYEGFLALGRQQFEQAKLSWCYAISNNVDTKEFPSNEVIELYNCAEDSMEKGMRFWEESEKTRMKMTYNLNGPKLQLPKLGSSSFFKETSLDETSEQAAVTLSQIELLWGTILYERSVVEFKLELPVWHETLAVAVEKFALAGAYPTDIAVLVKNHCSNNTSLQDFKIEELVQAWNEMYEARKWQRGIQSFRLEPLFRRRVSKICQALEHA